MQTSTTTTEVNKNKRLKTERNLKADTSSFCLSDRLADVSFAFKDSSTELPAHRLLLSMRSDVFEAMFYGPLAESSQTIKVEDIDISTMEMILRYIYTDDVTLNGKNVLGCLYAAKKYALYGLVDKCTEFLANAMSADTACSIFEQAKIYDDVALQMKCFKYILENSESVFRSNDFLVLSHESFLKVIASDYLCSGEAVNFKAALRWAQAKSKPRQQLKAKIRACLGDILFSIRFPLMAIDTFAKEVVPTGLLTKEETIGLYNHLATKEDNPEKQEVGRFSSKKRNIVISVNSTSLQPADKGCILVLGTSKPLKLVSFKGDFVSHVARVQCSHFGIFDIHFEIKDDCLKFNQPIVIKPQFGNVPIIFKMKGNKENLDRGWTAFTRIDRKIKDMTINIRRVPCGLRTLVFNEI